MMLTPARRHHRPRHLLRTPFMPGEPLNASGVNDPKLTEMIKLQRRTFDEKKRREIVYDIQRYASQQVYYGSAPR